MSPSLKSAFNQKLILTDVDGVLLEFRDMLYRFLKEEKNIHIDREEYDTHEYLIDMPSLNITRDEQSHIIVDFYHSDYFRMLEPMPHARENIEELREDGWDFVAITAAFTGLERQDQELTRASREHNLRTLFGEKTFSDIIITNFRTSKDEALSQFESAFWVEDTFKYARAGADLGHHSFLIKTDYQKIDGDHAKLTIVKDWRDIKKVLKP